MDNEEKYLLYKKKLKKYSIAMLIISLLTATVHICIAFNYMKNCIHITSGKGSEESQVDLDVLIKFISETLPAISSIWSTVLLLFAAVVSAVIYRNISCEKYDSILKLIYFGAAAYIIIIAAFAAVGAIFLTICTATLFLAIPMIFDIFSAALFVLVFGSVGGFFWTLIAIDMRSVLKNLMFYKDC